MVATRHTQSLTDFRQKATSTLDRLNRTGEAEVITVNGEARAVLLSPQVFDELTRAALLAHDVAAIRQSLKEIDEGKEIEIHDAFKSIRRELSRKPKKAKKR